MKKVIITLLMLSGVMASAQDKLLGIIPLKDGQVFYEKIVDLDSTKKDQIYSRVKLFISKKYVSSNEVIQLDDKESGIILVKGNIKEEWQANWASIVTCYIHHELQINIKDGKVKLTLKSFVNEQFFNDPARTILKSDLIEWNKTRPENKKKFLVQLNSDIESFIKSFETEIGKCDHDDVKNFCASLEGIDPQGLLQAAKRIAL